MAVGVGEGDVTGSDSGWRGAGGKLRFSFKGMARRSSHWRGGGREEGRMVRRDRHTR